LGKILGALAKNATQVLAPLAAFFVAFPGDAQTKIALAAAGFVIITSTSSVLRYWFFRFQIGDDAILIREGVINKKQLDIKFRRIQGIKSEQSFVYRWFDLVTIAFDTAGSAGNEGELPAVKTALADALRERIAKVSKDAPGSPVGEAIADTPPLLKLGWRDMIRIGLADRRAFVFLAVIAPFFDQLSEEFGQAIANQIEDVAADVAAMGPAIATTLLSTMVLLVCVVLVIGSIVAAFLRYHNFTLFLDGGRLRSVGGLLTRHEATMETGKVQVARISQGLVLRWTDRIRVVLKQASSKTQKASKSFVVPAAPSGFQQAFVGDICAPDAVGIDVDFDSETFERVDRRFLRSRILYGALLPVLVLTPLAWLQAGPAGFVFLLWLPLWSAIQWRLWRRLGWSVSADAFVRRKGFVGKYLDVFLLRKVQRVTLTQSPYQRRKALATVTFHLASGSIRLPYMALENAETIRDYVLFKVESSTRSWH
jgi:putative membrane protein